ncbi:MAG: chorismate-binding protein, partial [Actinobacteria bacterium]|nr:chorismate-binding protein [Actinomycetota bacterium]
MSTPASFGLLVQIQLARFLSCHEATRSPRPGACSTDPGHHWKWAPSPAGLAAQDAKLGLDDFISLAKSYSVIPVWKEVVADTLTPVAAFLRAVGHKEGFLLESVEGGERWGRYSFIGRAPLARVVARGAQVHTKGALLKGMETGSGILKACEDILAAYHTPEMDGLPPLHSGLVGYLGYDVVREVESLPGSPPDDLNLPDAVLDVIGELVAIDHWRQRCVVIANVMVDPEWTDAQLASAYQSAVSKIHNLIEDLSTVQEESLTEPPDPHESSVEALRTVGSQQYRTWVEIAKEHILEGDIFQVVLSQRFDFDLQADPFDVYRVLRMVNPSPYLYFLRSDEATIAGASPEPMVRVRDGTVISRPIAGTRPRGSTPTQDRLFAAELAEDPKEPAA